MRKMLSTKAGATFNEETPTLTFAVRKENIELVFKIKAGVYAILTLWREAGNKGMLFANWGRYFDRLTNPQVQMPKLQKCCPTLYDILVGDDKDGVFEMDFGPSRANHAHGFGMSIDLPKETPLIECLNRDIIHKADIVVNKMLISYNELISNPPFPAWKTGLDEVWE